jgi:MFS family permease
MPDYPRPVRDDHAERWAFAGVFTATLCGFLAVGAVLPVLPRYVKGPIGGGDVAVGIVIGAISVTALLGRPLAGRRVDAGGRRTITVLGLLSCAVGGALLFVDAGVAGLVVARLFVGFGDGWMFTAGVMWIVDLTPANRRGRFIGLYGLSIWGGLTFGSVIGEALYRLGSYDAVWAFAALAPVAGAVLASRVPDRHAAPDPEGTRDRRMLPSAAVMPGSALALATLGYSAMAAFVVLHLDEAGIGHGATVYTAFAASVVLTRLALGSLPDRVGSVRTVGVAVLFEAVGLVVVALAGAWPVALGGAIVAGMGFSLLFPALALLVVTYADERSRGAALAAYTGFFDLGMGVGAPLAGAIASVAGYPAAFCVAAAIALVGGVVSTLGPGGRPRPDRGDATAVATAG